MFTFIIHYAPLFAQAVIGYSRAAFPAISSFFGKKNNKKNLPVGEDLTEEKDYAIIVFAHDQTQPLQPLLHSLLQLNYNNYLVYVVINNSSNNRSLFNLPHSPFL